MNNTDFWNQQSRATSYAKRESLYPSETTFLEEYGALMKDWRMLDIGIGGGRSTVHFAPLAGEYIGTDFSKIMVDECVAKFDGSTISQHINDLQIVDVRDLSRYEPGSFDFVLFSFNGIDEISHEDRQAAFREIRKVMKDDGLFLFSSHNLQAIRKLFRFNFALRPDRFLKYVYRYIRLKAANRKYSELYKLDTHALIHDYYSDYSKSTYYVHPEEQFRQLGAAGFTMQNVYSCEAGGIINLDVVGTSSEPWLHYLCRAS